MTPPNAGKTIRKRRFHFKNMPLKDPDVECFNKWSSENVAFYMDFRAWLSENGYGSSALGIYGAAVRMALGLLRKPYWSIDPEKDIDLAREHLKQSHRRPSTNADYEKGLKKLAEYLSVRRNLPKKEKKLPWEFAIGALSQSLQDDIHEFLSHCQRNWKVEQRFERGRDLLYGLGTPLRWLAENTGLDDITKLTPQRWYQWLDHRLLAGGKASTANCDLTSLKQLVSFLLGAGHLVCERFLLVEPLDLGFRMPRDVPLDDLRKLQTVVRQEANKSREGCMDLAWFLLMLHCGLRTCEIRNLKLDEIEWSARRIRIEQSKEMKDRLVYLDDAVLSALRAYLDVRGQALYLPQNVFIYRHLPLSRSYCFTKMETYGKRCAVKAPPHWLRHSCATLLLNSGAPVITVQMILGHKRIDSTLGYARLYDGTVAADYYSAMTRVEQQLALPEDRVKEPPGIGQLIALADALRSGSLNPAQAEIVRALREGLGLLEVVKVLDEAASK